MLRAILFTLLTICFARHLSAQASALTIFPDPALYLQYPNIEITYYLFPWFAECHVLDTVIGGQVVNQEFYDGKMKVTIIWQEPADNLPGQIVVTRPSTSCNYAAPSQILEVPVVSFVGVTLIVTGETQYYMGQENYVDLTADLSSPMGGKAILFEWQAPPGWAISIYGPAYSRARVQIHPHNPYTENCIKVRGQYPWGIWSDWVDYCLTGTIPSPCPIQFSNATFLCGDTTQHLAYAPTILFPNFPEYNWSPPQYTWAVPSTWNITSFNANTQNAMFVSTDGHTPGSVSVYATGGDFTSAVCTYPVDFQVAHPATTVSGPDYVCQTGDFQLNIAPPPQSETTWEVVPISPNTPQLAFPDHGSGRAVFQITDTTASGRFRIHYTVTNQCGSLSYNKDFFIGKPRFFNTMLDGAPYDAQPLCAGNHGASTEISGMTDPQVIWSASPQIKGYTQRDSFVFSLAAAGAGNCPVVTASAGNVCGTSVLPLETCVRADCSPLETDVQVFPNPAYYIVSLETTTTDAGIENYALIENVEVFNQLGELVATWHEPPNHRIVKAVADFASGLYTLRITVWGQPIIKRLAITRSF